MKKTARRKVVLREGDDTLVSFGGGILLDEFISRLGLAELINQKVKVKTRERGYRESEAILGLAAGMITGGECLDDLFVLREEKEFGAIWSHGEIPHPTTMGDFLRRFSLTPYPAVGKRRCRVLPRGLHRLRQDAFPDVGHRLHPL